MNGQRYLASKSESNILVRPTFDFEVDDTGSLRNKGLLTLFKPQLTLRLNSFCRDVTLNGFVIPARTQVVPLLHAVHMDPELWHEPETFQPSRFLSPEGKVQKPEYFMPFGVGRRMCLGETLARMEIFLFFTSLLHNFDVKLPEGESLPSLRGNAGVTVTPDRFKVSLMQRPLDLSDDEEEPSFNERSSVLSDPDGPLRNMGSH